jgi:AraC-like DNA-binding protein
MQPKATTPRVLVISEQSHELKQKLEHYGAPAKLLVTLSGDEGLSVLSERPVEAVLLHLHSDWQPDVELLRHIRTFFPYLPVVILAECSTLAGAEACAGFATQGYLRLPLSAGELWRTVESALFACNSGGPLGFKPAMRRKEVDQALSLIQTKHREGISARQVAQQVCLSRNHLGSLFKKYTGHTLSEYINLCRVATAACLIGREPDLGFAQVAGRAGFSSESYLCKVFKRLLGVSPNNFRRKVLREGPQATAHWEALLRDLMQPQGKNT